MQKAVKKRKEGPTPGRPRAFDVDQALDRALQVFWQKGYEGASLADLTEAMGINRPSLYAAFGNKEALFRKVLDRYITGPAAYVSEALDEPTARGVIERLLGGAAASLTDPRNPRGCLVVHAALSCGEAADSIRRELITRRAGTEAALRRRFKRAKSEGDLPIHSDPADLARYIATLVQGMAVQAASGATRNELLRVVETVLRAWPA
jgi:AcrR family transcriptional regulator